jgi:hypothetical protein
MNKYRAIALGSAVAAGLAVTSLPAGAQSNQAACRSAAATKGAHIVAQNTQAVAFTQGGRLKGCSFSTGKVRSITIHKGSISTNLHTLHGDFLAYQSQRSNESGSDNQVVVYDLRAGKARLREVTPMNDVEGGGFVTALVVRAHGPAAQPAVGYIVGSPTETGFRREVHTIVGGEDRVVDSENVANEAAGTIGARSLATTEFDHANAFWLHGDQPRVAPLSQ